MTIGKDRRALALAAIPVLLAALLAWAWHDGGREPLRTIETPVDLPAPAGNAAR